VRAVEIALGIPVPGIVLSPSPRLGTANNVASAFAITANLSSILNSEVRQVLIDAAPIFEQVARQLGLNTAFAQGGLRWRLSCRRALVTKYVTMDAVKRTLLIICGWFVDLCRSVSWMSAGSTTTLQTQLMQLLDLKAMITTYIIRMY